MKKESWLMALVFLALSIPTVLGLMALGWGGEYQLWIAIIVGGAGASFAQWRSRRAEQERHS